MKRFLVTLAALCGLWGVSGCGGAGGGTRPPTATHFSITAQGNVVAGTAFNITVTALDAAGAVVSTYSGTVHFTSSDAQALLPAASALSGGTGTFSVTLMTPGSQTVTATDTASITGTSNSVMVTAVATHFSVAVPANATTGISFNFSVTALDASNNPVGTYSGTVHFTSSDAQASLPANSTVTNGTGTFSATLKTLGNQTIAATDTVTASITGTSSAINIVSTAATHFSVATPPGRNPGSAFTFTVKALDAANNVASTYSGTIHFASTDPQASLPANSGLTNGTGNFMATLNTLGTQTITATDTANASITGTSNSIKVQNLTITSGSPPNGTVGVVYGTPNCPQTGFMLSASVDDKFDTWSGSNLPPGLKVQQFTCPGVPPNPIPVEVWMIVGTPTQAGTFSTVVITLNDPFHGTASATYAITISASGSSVKISSGTPPAGTAAMPYDNHVESCQQGSPGCVCRTFPPGCFRPIHGFALTATGGTPPYSWSWTNAANSSLPPGLSVTPGGLISGTPTAAGTYQVTVTVTDSESPAMQASANYPLAVNLPPAPTINATPLPYSPTLKVPYSFTFTATSPLGPFQWSETGALPPGLMFSNAGVLSGTATMTGSFPISVTAQDSAGQDSTPQNFTIQVFPHGFQATGSMESPRDMHTATLLNNGQVLVAGGDDQEGDTFATAELFDPANGTFTPTGSMSTARANYAATLLSDGRVLVSGGGNASAELFDPAKGSFALMGSMETPRYAHTSTLLVNGQVLVAGGTDLNGNPLATAELFNPASGAFTPVGNMSAARAYYAAVLLSSGKVLLIGGLDSAGNSIATAELFDPSNGTFTPVGSLSTPRQGHTATLLCHPASGSCGDDRVLVAGGFDASGNAAASAELFDPASGNFATTGQMTAARAMHTATLLNDGTILLAGPDQTAEVFDPTMGSFAPTGTMTTARASQTATLLNNGSVLITGGHDVSASSIVTALSSAELYK